MTDKTVNMYLENCIQEIYDKKNIKTSEVIVITINLIIRTKRIKKIPITNACNAIHVCEHHSRDVSLLVMLERAYGGCLGTKSR